MLKPTPIYVYIYLRIAFLYIHDQGSTHNHLWPAHSKHPFCKAHYSHPIRTTKPNAHVFKYNLLTISSPTSVHSCVCETSDPAWGKKEGKRSWQYATIANPLVTTNPERNSYIHLYLPSHSIPKIKAQLTTTYGRLSAQASFLWGSLHSPSPNYQS